MQGLVIKHYCHDFLPQKFNYGRAIAQALSRRLLAAVGGIRDGIM
jgi:hypothetical protein